MQNKWIQAHLRNEWGVSWFICKYYFGDGYTIFTRDLDALGKEIHVDSSVPLRNITINLMDSMNCDWWTTIDKTNKRAINLALKTGFKFIKEVSMKDLCTGSVKKLNLYKRSLWDL